MIERFIHKTTRAILATNRIWRASKRVIFDKLVIPMESKFGFNRVVSPARTAFLQPPLAITGL